MVDFEDHEQENYFFQILMVEQSILFLMYF